MWVNLPYIIFFYSKSTYVYSFAMFCLKVLTREIPFENILLKNVFQSIHDGMTPKLPNEDYCLDYLLALIEKFWVMNVVDCPQFPIICQLLVDYKAIWF
jgi:hypothetical protein